MHDFCPSVQLSVQLREHWALGALPEHDCGAVHIVVDETDGHPLASTAQVAVVSASWHTVPAPVQIEAVQVQAAVPDDTVQAWCGPHVVVVVHAVQPLDCAWHVWTAPETHWVAPAVHALVQHVAVPAVPAHAPLVQVVVDDS
jgi:hypothetical protein